MPVISCTINFHIATVMTIMTCTIKTHTFTATAILSCTTKALVVIFIAVKAHNVGPVDAYCSSAVPRDSPAATHEDADGSFSNLVNIKWENIV